MTHSKGSSSDMSGSRNSAPKGYTATEALDYARIVVREADANRFDAPKTEMLAREVIRLNAMLDDRHEESTRSESGRMAEAERLLGEWLKKSDAHRPEIQEFKGGYQPFLERATRYFLDACKRNEPEWP